jgi:hypothetical protein
VVVATALERVVGQLSLQQRDTGSLRGDLRFLGESVADLLAQPGGRALAQAAFAETVAPSIAALARRQLAASADRGRIKVRLQTARASGRRFDRWTVGVSPGEAPNNICYSKK